MDAIPDDAKLPRNQMKRRIAVGIWEDMEGHIHWSLTELLAMVDLPNSPANRERVTGLLEQVIRKNNPSAGFVKREKPD